MVRKPKNLINILQTIRENGGFQAKIEIVKNPLDGRFVFVL